MFELAAQENKLKVLCTNDCLQDDIYTIFKFGLWLSSAKL